MVLKSWNAPDAKREGTSLIPSSPICLYDEKSNFFCEGFCLEISVAKCAHLIYFPTLIKKKLVDWVLQKLAQGGSKVSYFTYGNTAYEEWKLPLFATSNINYFCGQISSTCV